jgi:hypothetical protein
VNLVTCDERNCRRLATTFTTLADNPKPWPEVPYGEPWFGSYHVVPPWYACPRHTTLKHRAILALDVPPVCCVCGKTDGIAWVGGMTAYHYKPTTWEIIRYGSEGLNPNRDRPYCPACSDDYRSHWEEQWKDYRSSMGI